MDRETSSAASLNTAADSLRVLSGIHKAASESQSETMRYVAEPRRHFLARPRCEIERLRKTATGERYGDWTPPDDPPVTSGETREYLEAEHLLVGLKLQSWRTSPQQGRVAAVASTFLKPLGRQVQILTHELSKI